MSPKPLHILSGGAAQVLVECERAAFESGHGVELHCAFGAVGAMRDKLVAGADCDVLILSQALVDALQTSGDVVAGSARAVGQVHAGVALKSGAAGADIATPAQLRELLCAAGAIYVPDPAKATSGIHFMKVLRQLGLAESHAARLRTFPSGVTTMVALARSTEPGAVGCTQLTEILHVPGVQLAGLLPPPHELVTTYTAAVCSRATNVAAAQALVARLCSEYAAQARKAAGFV